MTFGILSERNRWFVDDRNGSLLHRKRFIAPLIFIRASIVKLAWSPQ